MEAAFKKGGASLSFMQGALCASRPLLFSEKFFHSQECAAAGDRFTLDATTASHKDASHTASSDVSVTQISAPLLAMPTLPGPCSILDHGNLAWQPDTSSTWWNLGESIVGCTSFDIFWKVQSLNLLLRWTHAQSFTENTNICTDTCMHVSNIYDYNAICEYLWFLELTKDSMEGYKTTVLYSHLCSQTIRNHLLCYNSKIWIWPKETGGFFSHS